MGKRLIDADELYRKVSGYQGGAVDKTVAKRLIEQAPTESYVKLVANINIDDEALEQIVDAAIVHCKDCIHNSAFADAGNALCELFYGMTDIYGFCHKGERRENG